MKLDLEAIERALILRSKAKFLQSVSGLRFWTWGSSSASDSSSSFAVSTTPVSLPMDISSARDCIFSEKGAIVVRPSLYISVNPSLVPAIVDSPAFTFLFLLYLKPYRSSWFSESPYLRSRVSKFVVLGKRLKSRTRLALSSLRISANFCNVSYMSSGTLERR